MPRNAQSKDQAFQWTKVPVPFVGGVDTRTDRKLVAAPKLGLLENAVFTTPGALRKRFGYQKLAELSMDVIATPPAFLDQKVTDGRALFTRAGALWLRGQENFYSLSADRLRWQREADIPNTHYVYGPRKYIDPGTPGTSTDMSFTSCATTGGVNAVVQEIIGDEAGVVATFYDAKGTELQRVSIPGAGLHRLVIVGTSFFIYYTTFANNLLVTIFSAPALLTGNAPLYLTKTLVSDFSSINIRGYDVRPAPNGQMVLAYASTTASTIKLGYVDTAGTAGSFTSVPTVAALPNGSPVSLSVEPASGNIALSWSETSISYVQIFTPALATLLARTSAGITGNPIVSTFRNATTVELFMAKSGTPNSNGYVARSTVTTTGTVTTTSVWLRHANILSDPWVVSGRTYLWTGRPTPYTTFDPANPKPPPVQRTAFLVVSGGTTDPMVLGAAYPGELQEAQYTPGAVDVVGSVVWFCPPLLRNENPLQPGNGQTYSGNIGVDYGRTPQCIEAGGASYVTGTALWLVDGKDVVESGFWEFPEFDSSTDYVTKSATGGVLAAGSYSYRAYYEWSSATGEIYRSATGADVVVTFASGSTNLATIKVPSLSHTLKSKVQVTLYRTLRNGTIFHLIERRDNDRNADFVSFVDNVTDQALQFKPIDYRSSSPPELMNLAPPGATTIAVGNTRVFLSGMEDPNLVLASKLRGFLEALNWNPTLEIQLPDANGEPVVSLASLGDALLAFRATHTYVIGGDGPDNVGLNGSFMPSRIVSDDIGCVTTLGVVRIPLGLLFESRKGIYSIGGDMGITYLGADVEAYNADSVTAAVSLPDRHEARFTLASGKTLVFDYLVRQWSVFTIGGIHACVWQGRHVYLPAADQGARAELAGSFLDDGQSYGWAWETAWIHVGENQAHQRVRTIQLLGEWMGDHASTVWIAYNYELAWSDRIPFDVSAVINGQQYGQDIIYGQYFPTQDGNYGGNVGVLGLVATSVYQVKLQPRRMRCQSIKVRWEETRRVDSSFFYGQDPVYGLDSPYGGTSYPWLEGARMNEIAFEIGLRGGLWRPGVDRTFGG